MKIGFIKKVGRLSATGIILLLGVMYSALIGITAIAEEDSDAISEYVTEAETAGETEYIVTIPDDAEEWIREYNYFIRDDDAATISIDIMNDVMLYVYCDAGDGTVADYCFDVEPGETGDTGELIYDDGAGTVLTYYANETFIYLSAVDSCFDGYYFAGSSFTEDWYTEYSEFQNRKSLDTVLIENYDFGDGVDYLEFVVNDTGLVYCYADAYAEQTDGGYLYTSEIGDGTAEYYPDDGNYLVITFNGESTTYQNEILYDVSVESEAASTNSGTTDSGQTEKYSEDEVVALAKEYLPSALDESILAGRGYSYYSFYSYSYAGIQYTVTFKVYSEVEHSYKYVRIYFLDSMTGLKYLKIGT